MNAAQYDQLFAVRALVCMGERVAKIEAPRRISLGVAGNVPQQRGVADLGSVIPASRVEAALGRGAQAIDEVGKIDAMAPLAIGSGVRWTGRLRPPASPALVRL